MCSKFYTMFIYLKWERLSYLILLSSIKSKVWWKQFNFIREETKVKFVTVQNVVLSQSSHAKWKIWNSNSETVQWVSNAFLVWNWENEPKLFLWITSLIFFRCLGLWWAIDVYWRCDPAYSLWQSLLASIIRRYENRNCL